MAESSKTSWDRGQRLRNGIVFLFLTAAMGGCASHSQSLREVREALTADNPSQALVVFREKKEKPNDLLYLLERGYLEMAAGEYAASNATLEAAELRAEDLYTKSVTGELAALVTSDNVLPYRSYPYELAMIQYYRAFNYLALGLNDDALVEARKANQLLVELADEKEGKNSYQNDAFLQYVTAMLYENAGETNDATVSYRNAYSVYADYEARYGVGPPPELKADLYRSLLALGADDEAAVLAADDEEIEGKALEGRDANVALFVETGFVPYLEPVDIILPIFDFKEDEEYRNCDGCELAYANVLFTRYGNNIYAYSGSGLTLDHVLRFAFPHLVDHPSSVAAAEVRGPDGQAVNVEPAEPLDAIARREFDDRLPKILLKTIGRALIKEFARTRAKKSSDALGALINIANVATEQADTRTWLFLPRMISMVKLTLPPGPHHLDVIFYDGAGAETDRKTVAVDVKQGEMTFSRVRSYR